MTWTRRVALGAAVTLLAPMLVTLGGVGAASAAVVGGTLDGGSDRFVTPGPVTVSGNDPGVSAGTVTISLGGTFVANVWVPNVIGTGDVNADGSWSVPTVTGPHAPGTDLLDVRVPAPGGGEAQLMQTWWFESDAADFAITSPAAGATLTSTPAGCLTLTAHFTGTPLTIQGNASMAHARFGDTVTWAYVSPGAAPGDVTACLPVSQLPDGPVTAWIMVGDGATSAVARTTLTLDLTTTASLSAYSDGDVVAVAGALHDAGPDLALTATFDGTDIPIEAAVGTVADRASVQVYRGMDVFAWKPGHQEITTTQLVPDGDHEFHLSMTSRGTTTDLGVFPVHVNTQGRLTIGAGSFVNGILNLAGELDNLPSPFAGQPLSVAATAGSPTVTDSTTPQVVLASPSQYGKNTWSLKDLVVPGGAGTVDVTVKGLDLHAAWTCVRVTVTGSTVTPVPCAATAPSPPLAVGVTASGVRTATVTLSAPTTDGGSPVTGYTVDTWDDFSPFAKTRFSSAGTSTTITLANLDEAPHGIEVRAVTAAGTSEPVTLHLDVAYPAISSAVASVPLGTRWPVSVSVSSQARLPSTTVQLQFQAAGTTAWKVVVTTTVAPDQLKVLSIAPTVSGRFRTVSIGQAQVLGGEGPAVALTVVPKPPVSIRASATSVRLRSKVTFSGATLVAEKGNRAHLQRLVSGRWLNVTSVVVASTGRYSAAPAMSPRGRYAYRFVLGAWKGRPAGVSTAIYVRTT